MKYDLPGAESLLLSAVTLFTTEDVPQRAHLRVIIMVERKDGHVKEAKTNWI